MKGTSAYKALMVAALVVALSVLALTGCVSVRVDKSGAASNGTTDSGSSASGVTLISSDSASTGTSTTSSSASASSTSTPSQATVTPANQLVEVRNSAGGYAFMTDKAFYTTEEGKGTMVYLAESKAGTPYFRVEVMDSSGQQTAEQLVDGTIDSIVSRYKDRMVVEPFKNSVKVSTGTLYGYEYAYKSSDGSQTVYAMSYVEDLNGKFVMYTANWLDGDTLTPKAVQVAADTMKV